MKNDAGVNCVTVIGHVPPPVTGENLCRRELVNVLRSSEVEVTDIGRREFYKLFYADADALLIYNGRSALGTVADVLATYVGLFRGKRVFWCFHNISWTRFSRVPRFLWLGYSRSIVPVVLRRVIADEFAASGYSAVVLNNCPDAIFEKGGRVCRAMSTKRLLWVGRLEAVKGFDTALACFKELRGRDPQWRFDVYGGTADEARAVGFFDEAVAYHGFVSGTSKVDAFSSGGIFLLPSRYVHETQPLSIIEAFSQGVPVVASQQGGIREMIETESVPGGISLAAGSGADYAEAVERIVHDYEAFSMGALRTYKMLFSRARFETGVLELVRERT